MYCIIGEIYPFTYLQTITVCNNENIINEMQVSMKNFIEEIVDAAKKYNVENIYLTSLGGDYEEKIIKDITNNYTEKYGENSNLKISSIERNLYNYGKVFSKCNRNL